MKRADPTRLYYVLEFLLAMPTWVAMAVYLVSVLHFSPLQLVLMGTAMEAAVFLCEVPTGVVADTYSRRLSLIVGYLGMGLAWMLVGVFSAAWAIIALWALWGVSYTFTSGAYRPGSRTRSASRRSVAFLEGRPDRLRGRGRGARPAGGARRCLLRAAVIAGGAVTIFPACSASC